MPYGREALSIALHQLRDRYSTQPMLRYICPEVMFNRLCCASCSVESLCFLVLFMFVISEVNARVLPIYS